MLIGVICYESIELDTTNYIIFSFVNIIGDGLFLIFAVFTYSAITLVLFLNKRKLSRVQTCHNNSSQRSHQTSSPFETTINIRSKYSFRRKIPEQRQLVPFLIILTFLVFYAVPDFIVSFSSFAYSESYANISWSIGYNFDPLIYVFLHKKTRSIALGLCKKRR